MNVKKKSIKDLFIKYLFSKAFVIDTPGFVTGRHIQIVKVGNFSRHVFIPEKFLANLEDAVIEAKGEEGKKILYSWGKVGLYRFAKIMGVPTLKNEKDNKSIKTLFKFLSIMYYNELDTIADAKNHTVTLKATNMAVSRFNGKGYFIPQGSVAGLLSYAYQDKSIEAIQPHSEGRGDKFTEIIAGPINKLNGEVLSFPNFPILEKDQKYDALNKPIRLSSPSLKEMINKYFFKYEAGRLEIWGERFFPFEIGIFYYIEKTLIENDLGNLLFEVTKKYFAEFSKNKNITNKNTFFPAFMKAIGWGDIKVLFGDKKEVICSNYPWTNMYSKNSTFPYFSGAFSGFYGTNFKKEKVFITDDIKLLLTEAGP